MKQIQVRWRLQSLPLWLFRSGALEAQPVLLEPMMKVEVTTPEDWMGDVVGDISNRRGIIEGMDEGTAGLKIIRAQFRCLSCSVTQLIYVLRHKVVLLTLWSLVSTLKCLTMLQKQSLQSVVRKRKAFFHFFERSNASKYCANELAHKITISGASRSIMNVAIITRKEHDCV